MLSVSENMRNYLSKNGRTFYARLLDGSTVISGKIRKLVIHKGSCDGINFQPASVFSNYVDVEIDYCTDNISGKKLKVQIGCNIDGNMEWITVATIYAVNPVKKNNKTTFTGLGVISAKLGKKWNSGSFTDINSLLSAISGIAGCNVYLDGLSNETIPAMNLSNYYYREVLSLIAGVYFGYVTETAGGDIVIRSYKKEGGRLQTSVSRMKNDADLYDEVTPQGIQIVSSEDSDFSCGDLQNCSLTNPLMTQDLFDKYNSNFVGFTYRPHTTELTLGDFTLEEEDLVSITSENGLIAENLRCMSITHSFDGGIITTISAPTLDSGEDYSRGIVQKEAKESYDAYVQKGINKVAKVEVYRFYGPNIREGYLWVEGGYHAYARCKYCFGADDVKLLLDGKTHIWISTDSNGGHITFDEDCPYRFGNQLISFIVPTFYQNGEEIIDSGGLIGRLKLWTHVNNPNVMSQSYELFVDYTAEEMRNKYGGITKYENGVVLPNMTFEADIAFDYPLDTQYLPNIPEE